MQKQVLHNQSVFDIAIQESGSVLAAFEWAFVNGISVTDDLTPGQWLTVPDTSYTDSDIVDYFAAKNYKIATGINADNTTIPLLSLGIGSMVIGSTFIIG